MLIRNELRGDNIVKPINGKAQLRLAESASRELGSQERVLHHSSWNTTAKALVRWLECYNAFYFWEPFGLQWSRNFH
jgi:hypothetical protein